MRHNDARKWLHAALDLLPVLLIPVFMIYSHRHTMTQQTQVDIQYKYQTNEVNSINDVVENNVYHADYFRFENNNTNGTEAFYVYILTLDHYDFIDDTLDNYLFETYLNKYDSSEFNYVELFFQSDEMQISICNKNAYAVFASNGENWELNFYDIDFYYLDLDDTGFKDYLQNISLNPNISASDFNVIESVDVHDETSSVMNVFMDNFNGAIDKYFNMGNVFNLNGVYQWFNTNIFGGNAPTIIYSVWNIALYELIMDLLFLLYGLFMWFIDMCKHLMEKPFRSIK